jgi:hypothetical protein
MDGNIEHVDSDEESQYFKTFAEFSVVEKDNCQGFVIQNASPVSGISVCTRGKHLPVWLEQLFPFLVSNEL